MRAGLLFAIVVAGCSSSAGGNVSDSGSPADMAAAAPDAQAVKLDLLGRIIGLDRQPLPGVSVSICQDTCRDATTGAQGDFSFPESPAAFYTLHARLAGDSDYAELNFPLYLTGDSNPQLLPLVLPKVGPGAPILPDQQDFPIDATMSLTSYGKSLQSPTGEPLTSLGGVRIPTELFPDFCVPSSRVLAMWAFTPTGLTTSVGIWATVSESLGLAPGTRVRFIEINPHDGRPQSVANAAVSADGKIKVESDVGLRQLSWLLVAVDQGGA